MALAGLELERQLAVLVRGGDRFLERDRDDSERRLLGGAASALVLQREAPDLDPTALAQEPADVRQHPLGGLATPGLVLRAQALGVRGPVAEELSAVRSNVGGAALHEQDRPVIAVEHHVRDAGEVAAESLAGGIRHRDPTLAAERQSPALAQEREGAFGGGHRASSRWTEPASSAKRSAAMDRRSASGGTVRARAPAASTSPRKYAIDRIGRL